MNPRRCAAFTWVEAMVAIAVICVLVALALPAMTSPTCGSPVYQTLSNMRQLHLATQTMALDGTTTGETNLNWPGDMGGSYSNWMTNLVPSYLTTNDFCKLMSAPGISVPNGRLPSMKDTALRVYAVRDEDGTNTVFLTTANFTNTPSGGAPLAQDAKPYGNKIFVVFRRGGDGAVLLPKQAGSTNVIGTYAPMCR